VRPTDDHPSRRAIDRCLSRGLVRVPFSSFLLKSYSVRLDRRRSFALTRILPRHIRAF